MHRARALLVIASLADKLSRRRAAVEAGHPPRRAPGPRADGGARWAAEAPDGALAAFERAINHGMDIAISEINAAGGVRGRNSRVVARRREVGSAILSAAAVLDSDRGGAQRHGDARLPMPASARRARAPADGKSGGRRYTSTEHRESASRSVGPLHVQHLHGGGADQGPRSTRTTGTSLHGSKERLFAVRPPESGTRRSCAEALRDALEGPWRHFRGRGYVPAEQCLDRRARWGGLQ